jgi:hypothetical protein
MVEVGVPPSVEAANAFQAAEIHPDKKGSAHDIGVRHKAPIA